MWVRSLSKRRHIWGMWMYVSALRLESGELLIVVSDHPRASAIQDYGRRWQIETLFGCLKSRGFDLESTHITEAERLTKMIFLLTLTLCWAHRVDVWLDEHRPLLVKKHGHKAQSFFRYGLDFLRNIFFDIPSKIADFHRVLKLLSCT